MEEGRPTVDIPILRQEEYALLKQMTTGVKECFIPAVLPPLSEHLKNTKAKLPAHLKSVPEQKQFLTAMNCLHMAMVNRATQEKLIFAEMTDPCPPMILIVEK